MDGVLPVTPRPSVRAKFVCNTVETTHPDGPVKAERYRPDEPDATIVTWRRTYRFGAVYDTSIPEDERYAQATPYGELKITVDNPAVAFIPGQAYYLDFTPA